MVNGKLKEYQIRVRGAWWFTLNLKYFFIWIKRFRDSRLRNIHCTDWPMGCMLQPFNFAAVKGWIE